MELRRGLSGHNLKFPAFGFACLVYLDKIGELERASSLVPSEEMDFLAELAEGILKYKYVGLVSLFFKLGGKHLGRGFMMWLKKRRLTKEQLGRIPEMEETELLEALPVLFAKDLNACLSNSTTQRIVLLFDGHDAFWGVEQQTLPDERRPEFDSWVRAFLSTVNLNRGIVIVVAGRDIPLHWADAFNGWKIAMERLDLQHIEGLSREDSLDFLRRAEISNPTLCEALLRYAQLTPGSVHPLFLRLCTEVIQGATSQGIELAARGASSDS